VRQHDQLDPLARLDTADLTFPEGLRRVSSCTSSVGSSGCWL
jgi:hypothetical protein